MYIYIYIHIILIYLFVYLFSQSMVKTPLREFVCRVAVVADGLSHSRSLQSCALSKGYSASFFGVRF